MSGMRQNVGHVPKMSGKSVRLKAPVGKTFPLKTVALALDEKEKTIESSRGTAQSWWTPSQV